MAGWIPEETLSEIRSASDIVDVVSEVVILKRAGRNFIGLCPFHAEKTPSFTVSPEKQIFYCFGCGAGGNIFTFLMKYHGMAFFEAVTALADRSGVSLPEKSVSSAQRRQKTDRERILEINRIAMEYYHRRLLDKANGRAARQYLHNRGIKEESLEAFAIGYAPAGWDPLISHLNQQRIPLDAAFKAGLIIPGKKRSGGYDRFRNRILFPIRDLGGRVIGFGGRVMDDSLPKYINSPESPVFQKGRSLYGLDRAKAACRRFDAVILVEGYFDVIALHQFGVENAVATLGTGVTGDHIRLLKGFAQRLYFVFDPDAAGLKAVERIVPALVQEDVTARIVTLPEGKDPDAFIREKGPDAFFMLMETAAPAVSFLIESAKARHGLSPSGKSRIAAELESVLASIDDEISRSIFVKSVAEEIGVPEDLLLKKVSRVREKGTAAQYTGGVVTPEGAFSTDASETPPARFEKKILSMMLQYPLMVPEIQKRGILEYFADDRLKAIGRRILEYRGPSEGLIPELISMVEDPEIGERIAHLAAGDDSWNTEGCLKLIRQFEQHCDRARKDALNARIQEAQKENNHALVAALLKEKQKMLHKRD